ncbi:MAG: peptidylprolyl isomerase [Gammaproteobacteria bacterium]|nr:peptidylprolyl isomerase [Gammaproteobacteria bacterium]MCD8542738.1 peptidylprolyl isomerase [Gammaproteobacteria bacterium]
MVVMDTNFGQITVKLTDNTPVTTKNFLYYVHSGFYDNTIFHRVIHGFMIQGGGLLSNLEEKPHPLPPIPNEGDHCLANTRGVMAMARTSDPHSATSQFFINVVDNPFLNFQSKTLQGWGYCGFGEVIDGMAVVDAIASVETGTQQVYENVPRTAVILRSARVR